MVIYQMSRASKVAAHEFPGRLRVFIVDRSPVHTAMAEDALNANDLNAHKAKETEYGMRDGWFTDSDGQRVMQRMTTKGGKIKPMSEILSARGLLRPGMSKRQMRAVLASQPDFRSQRTLIEEDCPARDEVCLFLPRCHPELNPQEMIWAAAKRKARGLARGSIKALRSNITKALGSVSLASIRAYFERVDAFAAAYRKGKSLADAQTVVTATAKARRAARKADRDTAHDETPSESESERESESENETETDTDTESEGKDEEELEAEAEDVTLMDLDETEEQSGEASLQDAETERKETKQRAKARPRARSGKDEKSAEAADAPASAAGSEQVTRDCAVVFRCGLIDDFTVLLVCRR